jgi:hypothetical protein
LFSEPSRSLAGSAFTLALVSALVLAACTGSEPVDVRNGAGGEAGGGEATAGTSGAAGTVGAAGSSSSGAAGTNMGNAGTGGSTGAGAGAGSGSAGSSGSAGTGGSAGRGGTAGSNGAAGTSGGKDAGVEAPPATAYTYTTGIENLLVQNCGGCHYAAPGVNVQGGFSFSYANVTGVTNGHPGCTLLDASKRRVVPGKPENSLLYIKANLDNPPSSCGGHMPFMGSRLSDNNLKVIYNWILAGAPM